MCPNQVQILSIVVLYSKRISMLRKRMDFTNPTGIRLFLKL